MIFSFAVRNLWIHRNKFMFSPPSYSLEALIKITYMHAYSFKFLGPNTGQIKNIKTVTHVSWSPPPPGVVKINTDGSVYKDGNAGAGAVIRNHISKWIVGTSRKLHGVPVSLAELWPSMMVFLCVGEWDSKTLS